MLTDVQPPSLGPLSCPERGGWGGGLPPGVQDADPARDRAGGRGPTPRTPMARRSHLSFASL